MQRTLVRTAAVVFVVIGLDLALSHAQAPAPGASGDCCTQEAQKKIADSLGFVDIAGIKLGMSPQEAVAAVKAHDPSLKFETLTARMEDPSGPLGNFLKVPYSINAHSINRDPNKGPVEWIALRFTSPPNRPVVAKIVRYTGFQVGQPVTAANLLEALRKKYGQENVQEGGYRAWVYGSDGKLLTRTLTGPEQGGCVGNGVAAGVAGGGLGDHPSGETGMSINLTTTSVPKVGFNPDSDPACAPLVFAAASSVGSSYAPSSPQIQMTVTLESGALLYVSTKSTHDWLQAKLDGTTKQQNDANQQRAAPKL